jgi:ppGpp synthetase/RelA/SpoT-type nucleotidyltranferase
VWSLKAELEDLCFQYLHPAEHAELQRKLGEVQQQGTLEEALNILKGAMESKGIDYEDLSGRPKNLYGIFTKMRAKNYQVDQVYDARALRVIVKRKEDCYQVLRQVETLWTPFADKFKDYIRHPKDNGYQSLHTVVRGSDGVPIEIQIRTPAMHYIAEYGVAAHWRYKEKLGVSVQSHLDQLVAWGRWLITWQLELVDKKCRPSGSPGRDTSLTAFYNRLHPSTVPSCAFPQHAADCKFANFLRASNLTPQPAAADGGPIYVMLFDGTSGQQQMHIQETPPGCTTAQLLQSGLVGGAAAAAGANVRVLVNAVEVHSSQAVMLRHGDKVEVFVEPVEEPVLEIAGALDATRERLNRLWNSSGDLASWGFRAGQPVVG